MTASNSIDALVVGAGPTGLAMTTELLRNGLKVRLIDLAEKPTTLSKAVVLMPRTLEEFQMRGMHERALKLGEPVHSFSAYFHNEIIFHADYQRVSSHYNYLLNIPQCDTEMVLREELEKLGGTIEWQTQLESFEQNEDQVTAQLKFANGETERLEVPYLLGCDGAHSVVRHGIGGEFHGGSYHDTWLLADVSLDWNFPHGHTYSFFSDDGLLAVFAMPNGRYRLYVVQPEQFILGRDPELADVVNAVERIAPGKMRLSEPTWLSEFHCHHRKVKSYRQGRVFLAGDAAHIHSPESGLGMNTGIQDAFNLGWKLAAVSKGICPSSLLETYDQERSFVGEQVVHLSDFTHKMSVQFNMLGNLTRSWLWRFFSSYYLHHFERLEEGFQVRIHYQQNDFIEHHGRPSKFRDSELPEVVGGTRLLDGELLPPGVKTGTSGAMRLYNLLDPTKFSLVLMAGPHPSQEKQSAIWNLAHFINDYREHCQLILILGRQHADPYAEFPGTVVMDPTQFLHYKYGVKEGAVYLVRPDAYVAFSHHDFAINKLEPFLKRLFQKT